MRSHLLNCLVMLLAAVVLILLVAFLRVKPYRMSKPHRSNYSNNYDPDEGCELVAAPIVAAAWEGLVHFCQRTSQSAGGQEDALRRVSFSPRLQSCTLPRIQTLLIDMVHLSCLQMQRPKEKRRGVSNLRRGLTRFWFSPRTAHPHGQRSTCTGIGTATC